MGKQMEGNNRQRRAKARDARDADMLPSEEGATFGASKQRKNADSNARYPEKLDQIRQGKQKVIRENTPERKPGYGTDE